MTARGPPLSRECWNRKDSHAREPATPLSTVGPRAGKKNLICDREYSGRDTSTRSRDNHMHDHARFQSDFYRRHKCLSLPLSQLLLTKVTHAQ